MNFVPDFVDSSIDFSMLGYPMAATGETLLPFEQANKIHVFVFGWKDGGRCRYTRLSSGCTEDLQRLPRGHPDATPEALLLG